MPATRLVLVGDLDATSRDRFRAAGVRALDLAAGAHRPLVIDCRGLDNVDELGAMMLVALARTARGMATPVHIEAAPIELRGRLELVAAIDLFEWIDE